MLWPCSDVVSSRDCLVDICSSTVFSKSCRGIFSSTRSTSSYPPLTLVFLLLFHSVFPSIGVGQCFALPQTGFSWGTTSLAMGSAVPWGGSSGAGWKQQCQAEDSSWPFLPEATPAAPSPGTIDLAKCIHLGERDHRCQNLCALFSHSSIQRRADVGEANASPSAILTLGAQKMAFPVLSVQRCTALSIWIYFPFKLTGESWDLVNPREQNKTDDFSTHTSLSSLCFLIFLQLLG